MQSETEDSPELMKPSDLCLPVAPNILHAECHTNASENKGCPVDERHKDLWRRILSFCDSTMMVSLRCTCQNMNTMVLESLREGVGFISPPSSNNPSAIFALTNGLMTREAPRVARGGTSVSLEEEFATRADIILRRDWCSSKEMEQRVSFTAARDGYVDAQALEREWLKLTQPRETRIRQKSLGTGEDRCMEEWLTYLNESRRAQFNIRHGLFNYYSTKGKPKSFFLPDGTLCVTQEEGAMQLISRRGSRSSHSKYRVNRKEENTQTVWSLQTAYFFDDGILSSFYDVYSGNIYIQTNENLWEVKLTTPSMIAVQQRVYSDDDHDKDDDKNENVRKTEIGYTMERRMLTEHISNTFKIDDSIPLPPYRWNSRNVRFAVKSILACDEERVDSPGPEEEEAAWGLEQGPQNTYIVYDGVDETQKVFLDSERCPYMVSSDLSMIYEQMRSELKRSLVEGTTVNERGAEGNEGSSHHSSTHSANGNDTRERDSSVVFHRADETTGCEAEETLVGMSSSPRKRSSPFAAPSFVPSESHPAEKLEVETRFVFTAFPGTSLLVGSGSMEEHLLIPQGNFTSSVTSGGIDYIVSRARCLSVGKFEKIVTTDRIPLCDKTVFDLNEEKNTISASCYHWILESEPSVEESEILVLASGSDDILSRVRVRRCLVSKLAKRSISTISGDDSSDVTAKLHKRQLWFLCRGYAYYISGTPEVLAHFPMRVCSFPRPWTTDLLAKLSYTRSDREESTFPPDLLRGSNGVEWRPRYDGHPYFSQPFLFYNFDRLTLCVPGYKKVVHSDDALRSPSGVCVGLTVRLDDLMITDPQSHRAISTVTRSHAQRYAQIVNQVSTLTISPTNAYFILATYDGRIILLAPSLTSLDLDSPRRESEGDEKEDISQMPTATARSASTHSAAEEPMETSGMKEGGGETFSAVAGGNEVQRAPLPSNNNDDDDDLIFVMEEENNEVENEVDANREKSSSVSSGKGESGFIGFAGTTCDTYHTRHYRCTSVSSSVSSSSSSLSEQEGVGLLGNSSRRPGQTQESSSRKCRLEMDDLFGPGYRRDQTLQYIQRQYPSIMDQWDRQIRKPRSSAESSLEATQEYTSLRFFLRVPLYACFLKVERDSPRVSFIKEMHADGWKLTTLNSYFDIVIYDLSALQPEGHYPHRQQNVPDDNTEARRRLQYPCIIPLISLGLLSRPTRSITDASRLERSLFSLTSATYQSKLYPSIEWQNGMLLLNTSMQLLCNTFLLDFSASYDLPSFLKEKLPSSSWSTVHGPLPQSASCSTTMKEMQSWLGKHDKKIKGYQADIHRLVVQCSQYREPENEDLFGLSTTEIESTDYYPLDLLCCADAKEGGLQKYISYDAFIDAQKSTAIPLNASLNVVSLMTDLTGHPPHFKSLKTEYGMFLLYNLISPFCLLLLIPYVILNAVNLSSKKKVMPYLGVFPFILPTYILLISIQSISSFHRPFRTVIQYIIYAIITLLLAVFPLLFALKHDEYLPEAVTWWEISLTVVAATLLFIPFVIWDLNQPDQESPTIASYAGLFLFALVEFLLAIYFDFHSPSNPAAPLFPLPVAFLPLFLALAAFLFFRVKEEFLDEVEIFLKCVALIIGALFLFFILFPTILFIVNYSDFWRWYNNPTSQKPSCVVPAIFISIAIGFGAVLLGLAWIRIVVTICDE